MSSSLTLLTPKTIREICEKNEIHPTKTLGQNFMVDSAQVQKIVRAAGVSENDIVLEIGPGLGSLTLGLLETGAKVTAVEIDKKLAKLLPQTLEKFAPSKSENCTVFEMDALNLQKSVFENSKIPLPTKLVANLPYSVGTQIFLSILERFASIQSALILVQAEVAERLTAEPGSKTYGIPSVKTAFWGKASLSSTIPRSAFFPVPRVDSKLVSFKRAGAQIQPQPFNQATLLEKHTLYSDQSNTNLAANKTRAAAQPTTTHNQLGHHTTNLAATPPTKPAINTTTTPNHHALSHSSRENVFALINLAFSARRKTLRSLLVSDGYDSDRVTLALDSLQIDPLARGETLSVQNFVELSEKLSN